MPIFAGISLGVAGVGGIISGIGSIKQASAAARAAEQNQRLAERQMELDTQRRKETMDLSSATPEELGLMRQYVAQAESNWRQMDTRIKDQEAYLKSFDPVFQKAGSEALALLQGKEAAVLAPIRRQRQIQREQLKGRLRQQLGSGFETSTAGFQALNQFDQQTNDMETMAQQNTLNQFMGYANQGLAAGMQARNIVANTALQSDAALQQSYAGALTANQNIQNRMVSASQGTQINLEPIMRANTQQAAAAGSELKSIGEILGGLGSMGANVGGMMQQNKILDRYDQRQQQMQEQQDYDRFVSNRLYSQPSVTNFTPRIPIQQNNYGQLPSWGQ